MRSLLMLELRGLSRRYAGLHALREVNLTVPTGARHAVIGANGAGKTTLLNLIAGTSRATTGRILLDGHDITRLGPASRARRGIGRTFQHPAVFDRLTVADNIALALNRNHESRTTWRPLRRAAVNTDQVQAVLDSAGISCYVDHPAATLPYGLRRRLELAATLAARPRLLLLDEPSAGLAPADIDRLATTIHALPSDVTVVLVDHNLDLVWAVADMVTVLHHGTHLATGTPSEIRASSGVHAAYLTSSGASAPSGAGARSAPTTRAVSGPSPLLRLRNLRVRYSGSAVLTGVNLDIAGGDTVAILGRNGAGKTTLLRTIAGLHHAEPGSSIDLAGVPRPDRPDRIARAGVHLVPQGRHLFDLTVAEHLHLAEHLAHRRADLGADRTADRRPFRQNFYRAEESPPAPGQTEWSRADVLTLLPALQHRLHHHATQLSGGEQQMLALARALLGNPRLLLLDEPSEGLAPAVIEQLATAVQAITDSGVAVLLAEQNLPLAATVASRIVVLDGGQIAYDSTTESLSPDDERRRLDQLLGVTPQGRHSDSDEVLPDRAPNVMPAPPAAPP